MSQVLHTHRIMLVNVMVLNSVEKNENDIHLICKNSAVKRLTKLSVRNFCT